MRSAPSQDLSLLQPGLKYENVKYEKYENVKYEKYENVKYEKYENMRM